MLYDPAPRAASAEAPDELGTEQRVRLRGVVLALTVLDHLDLQPVAGGLLVTGPRGTRRVTDRAAAGVLGDLPADHPHARPRLGSWLRLHAAAHRADQLAGALRPLALPPGSALHPGAGWARARVPGGALDVGLGVVGVVDDEPLPVPLWPDVAERLDAEAAARGEAPLDLDGAWGEALTHLQAVGDATVAQLTEELPRLLADQERSELRGTAAPAVTVLEPLAGCDALTLLAARPVRRWLADADGTGLRVVSAPTRSRGWTDLARVDSDFTAAAWAATDPEHRGLQRPLLVTADELVAAPRWVG